MSDAFESGYTLALDQGSQSSRAIVYSATGMPLVSAQVPVETRRHSANRVEHDPRQLLESLTTAIREVIANIDPGLISRAGLATQRSSIVCWNRRNGRALTPVISWQDTRAEDWLEQFDDQATRVQLITGLQLSPHYGVSKMRWCLERDAKVRTCAANGELVMGPLASYLLFELLEEHPVVADPANASRTLLFDYRKCDWSDELLELFGVERRFLPGCAPTEAHYGTLVVDDLRVPLSIATGDQSAALYAFGNARSNIAYANIGTGAFLQRPVGARAQRVPGLLGSIVFSDGRNHEYVVEGTVNGAGSAVEKLSRELQFEMKWVREEAAEWLEKYRSPPLFLNGVSGLGSPWWVPGFRSRFLGDGDKPAQMVAVFESILFLLQANFDACAEHTGTPEIWLLTGGLARLDSLCQKLANLSGLPVARPAETEATAQGVAQLLNRNNELFRPDTETEWFEPADDAALIQRYTQWRIEMDKVIETECA